ncbi:hypothetical protein L7F22_009931 [Adiantum nelumboides]|nr:hypothetical protein [Adiantum nelumboides]
MMQNRSMKVAMTELLRPCRESIQSVEESEGTESGGDNAVEEMKVDEKFDVHDRDTELCHLRVNAGYIMEEMDISPKLVAEVFKVAHNPLHKGKKVTNAVKKFEFGQPKGSRAYYMVQNCGKLRSAHLFWYLDKVCLLTKTAYMSKEAFAPIYHAKRGQKGDWASFIFDRLLQLSEARDKRRPPSVTKVAPYLQAIFSHVLQVPLTPTPKIFVKSLEVQSLSDAKRRKFDWDLSSGDKLKSVLGQGSKSAVGTDEKGQSSGKEAMILTLETQKAEGERIDSLERELGQLQSRVDEVLKEKSILQEELAQLSANMRNQISEMARTTQEFQIWADGLTPLVDLERPTLDGQGVTSVLIFDADVDVLNKEVFDYTSLLHQADVDVLNKEVFDYTKELWHQAAGIFQEHMAEPVDKYKSWCEAAGEHKVRKENVELHA